MYIHVPYQSVYSINMEETTIDKLLVSTREDLDLTSRKAGE